MSVAYPTGARRSTGHGRGGTLQLVVFRLDTQGYALALEAVRRVLPMVAIAPLPEAPAVVLGVINLHGEILPVVDVRRRLGGAAVEPGLEGRLLVARSARRALALPVDEVIGVAAVPDAAVRPAASLLPGLRHIAGVAAWPGGVLYIQDLDALLGLEEEDELSRAMEAMGP